MFGFCNPLNDGRVIAVISNYLFDGLVFCVLVEVIQLISLSHNGMENPRTTIKFVGTDHLRTKIIINDVTLEQITQFII